jgi:hypothetical protein
MIFDPISCVETAVGEWGSGKPFRLPHRTPQLIGISAVSYVLLAFTHGPEMDKMLIE